MNNMGNKYDLEDLLKAMEQGSRNKERQERLRETIVELERREKRTATMWRVVGTGVMCGTAAAVALLLWPSGETEGQGTLVASETSIEEHLSKPQREENLDAGIEEMVTVYEANRRLRNHEKVAGMSVDTTDMQEYNEILVESSIVAFVPNMEPAVKQEEENNLVENVDERDSLAMALADNSVSNVTLPQDNSGQKEQKKQKRDRKSRQHIFQLAKPSNMEGTTLALFTIK